MQAGKGGFDLEKKTVGGPFYLLEIKGGEKKKF